MWGMVLLACVFLFFHSFIAFQLVLIGSSFFFHCFPSSSLAARLLTMEERLRRLKTDSIFFSGKQRI
jgi:hypothetical protein